MVTTERRLGTIRARAEGTHGDAVKRQRGWQHRETRMQVRAVLQLQRAEVRMVAALMEG